MKISELKGIGAKTEQLFNKLNIYNTSDLIFYYPRTYDEFCKPILIDEIEESGVYSVYGMVMNNAVLAKAGRLELLKVKICDQNGNKMDLTWFNMAFLKSRLIKGSKYIFRGKVAFKGNLVFMEQPAIFTEAEYDVKLNSMQPIYSLTAGLTNNTVVKAVKQCLPRFQNNEYLPDWILKKYDLLNYTDAIKKIHFPKDRIEATAARRRIVFDEFFLFSTSMRALKSANLNSRNNFCIPESGVLGDIVNNLEFSLTKSQENALKDIVSDMSGQKTMNRLIQGDVGSGKTIIAFLAMTNVIFAGYQCALMAPTEVLAAQHFNAFKDFARSNNLNINYALLTGSTKASEKRNIKEKLSTGEISVVIGTHAIITEDVVFNNLALVITDEQHRFGVRQRQFLNEKGNRPHTMVMSATPIPRSLAIILYGDLDVSLITEKPANRLPIKNCIVDSTYHKKAVDFITKELMAGHQAYVVCAMAEDSDNDELLDVKSYSEQLRKDFSEEFVIEYLHGKMKPSKKNEIMQDFADGKIHILVSTTVIEVGINVPNATVMMIENAERFGLAGLHQLRGRIGRGKDQSYCIFVSDTKSKHSKERLQILKESNDGFYIAEQDLKLRGPGDMLGTRQSGDMDFVLGDIYADSEVLKQAAEASSNLLQEDATLTRPENQVLHRILTEYTESRLNKISI